MLIPILCISLTLAVVIVFPFMGLIIEISTYHPSGTCVSVEDYDLLQYNYDELEYKLEDLYSSIEFEKEESSIVGYNDGYEEGYEHGYEDAYYKLTGKVYVWPSPTPEQ